MVPGRRKGNAEITGADDTPFGHLRDSLVIKDIERKHNII